MFKNKKTGGIILAVILAIVLAIPSGFQSFAYTPGPVPENCVKINFNGQNYGVESPDDWTWSGNFDEVVLSGPNGSITIGSFITKDDGRERTAFEWTSTIGISKVIVWAGSASIQEFETLQYSGTGSTLDNKEISHIVFCYAEIEQPTTGTLEVIKIVEGEPPTGVETYEAKVYEGETVKHHFQGLTHNVAQSTTLEAGFYTIEELGEYDVEYYIVGEEDELIVEGFNIAAGQTTRIKIINTFRSAPTQGRVTFVKAFVDNIGDVNKEFTIKLIKLPEVTPHSVSIMNGQEPDIIISVNSPFPRYLDPGRYLILEELGSDSEYNFEDFRASIDGKLEFDEEDGNYYITVAAGDDFTIIVTNSKHQDEEEMGRITFNKYITNGSPADQGESFKVKLFREPDLEPASFSLTASEESGEIEVIFSPNSPSWENLKPGIYKFKEVAKAGFTFVSFSINGEVMRLGEDGFAQVSVADGDNITILVTNRKLSDNPPPRDDDPDDPPPPRPTPTPTPTPTPAVEEEPEVLIEIFEEEVPMAPIDTIDEVEEVEEEVEIILEEEVPLAPLPKTGETQPLLFYGFGLLVSALGYKLKRK